MDRVLYFLIGPEGAGKTYIGSFIGEQTDIHFLRVEPIWLSVQEGENGWDKVAEEVGKGFENHSRVMIENLGVGEGFNNFHSLMKERYETRLIRVYADLNLCFKRVQSRDQSVHISVSDDKVQHYNEIASKVVMDWDLVIHNGEDTLLEDIKEAIISI